MRKKVKFKKIVQGKDNELLYLMAFLIFLVSFAIYSVPSLWSFISYGIFVPLVIIVTLFVFRRDVYWVKIK